MNIDDAMEAAKAYLAFWQAGEPLFEAEDVATTLAKEVERLRAMLVNLAIPVEALLLDEGSHKYIAPTVLAEIQAALKETRKQMRGEDERR